MYPKTLEHALYLVTIVAAWATCLAGCKNSETNANHSTNADTGIPYVSEPIRSHQVRKQINQSAMQEESPTTIQSRLVDDQRSSTMKQIFPLGDDAIAQAERTLLEVGVDRKYNITSSFVGGINKLRLEVLPNASQNKSIQVEFYFMGEGQALQNPPRLLAWLELDERLFGNETTGSENAR